MAKAKFDAGRVLINCPGCGHMHVLTIEPHKQSSWGFNGDMEKPTFTPSLLVQWGKFADPNWQEPEGEPVVAGYQWSGRCHSLITDGGIQFLTDSTHQLSGQTVELPDFKDEEG